MDRAANAAFYGSSSITTEQIFASSGNAAPAVANNFVQVLTAQTRRLPTQPAMDPEVPPVDAASGSSTSDTQPSSVRTYGIGEPESTEPDEGDYENF
jgi:hypothetical protein